MQDNQYARNLKAQGEYVIEVDGIMWYSYQGFMLPAYLPHCVPAISRQTALKVLKLSNRPFVRWDEGLSSGEQTPWWYILKRGPWSVDLVEDKKKRWMIRKGKNNFQVRPLSFEEVLEKCPDVAQMAKQRYQGEADVENIEILSRRIESAKKVPGILEFIGCFSEDRLVSYSENYIQNNAVWLAVIRHDPEYLKQYSSYGLMDGILDYYLNEKRMQYVLDGSRSIHHRTEFQSHLESVYGFTKEYSRMNIVYSPFFGGLLKLAYPFQQCFFKIQEKWVNHYLDKTCAIMRQESIRRGCASLPSPRTAPLKETEPGKLLVRPMQMGDIDQVVKIHKLCFPNTVSLFSVLNPRLAWHLYAQYVEEPKSVGMVLVDSDSGRIAGYAAGTLQPGFQGRFLRSHILRIAWHVLIGLCTKPVVWKMVARALVAKDPFKTYRANPLQFEKTPPGGPVGYFMPIAVHPEYRGGGNAVRLARALMDHFFALGSVRIRGNKIAIDNIASRRLFVDRLGWKSAVIEDHCVMVWADRDDFQPPAPEPAEGAQRPLSAVRTQYPPVFITYGWCRSSYAVLWALGQKALEVHVGDASSLAMSRYSRYAKSFSRLPDFFVEPDQYIDALLEALRKTGSQVLLPCHEDIGLISRHRDRFPEQIRMAVPDWETYRIAEDKLKLMDLVSQCGCPAPQIHIFHSEQELNTLVKNISWPAVLKTRIGNSAKGVAIAQNAQELKRKFHALVNTYNLTEERWPFLQEYLPGRAAGVCALYNHGKRITWFGEEYLRCKEPGRFGTSTLRRTWQEPDVIEQALTVLDTLKWHGLAHLDLIQDRQGVFKIIEINPRPWGAMALAVHAGIDFPWLWYQMALGDPINTSRIDPREIYCRWILGDCFAFIELLKKGKFSEAAKVFLPSGNSKHDDWMFSDPLPFVFQYFDYFGKFIKNIGRTSRAAGSMIR